MTSTTIYTEAEINEAVVAYAIHHEVEADAVLIDCTTADGGIVGFRLSLDTDGRSRGCDEVFGQWRR